MTKHFSVGMLEYVELNSDSIPCTKRISYPSIIYRHKIPLQEEPPQNIASLKELIAKGEEYCKERNIPINLIFVKLKAANELFLISAVSPNTYVDEVPDRATPLIYFPMLDTCGIILWTSAQTKFEILCEYISHTESKIIYHAYN